MFKKVLSLSLIALILFSCLGAVNAYAGTVQVHVSSNGCAKSNVEIWDQNGGYYKKLWAPDARTTYNIYFNIPDSSKWHNFEVKFNHGVAGQGPSVYVVIPHYTDGLAIVCFETYGDDVEGHYKGLDKYWNDRWDGNHFWLG